MEDKTSLLVSQKDKNKNNKWKLVTEKRINNQSSALMTYSIMYTWLEEAYLKFMDPILTLIFPCF